MSRAATIDQGNMPIPLHHISDANTFTTNFMSFETKYADPSSFEKSTRFQVESMIFKLKKTKFKFQASSLWVDHEFQTEKTLLTSQEMKSVSKDMTFVVSPCIPGVMILSNVCNATQVEDQHTNGSLIGCFLTSLHTSSIRYFLQIPCSN